MLKYISYVLYIYIYILYVLYIYVIDSYNLCQNLKLSKHIPEEDASCMVHQLKLMSR